MTPPTFACQHMPGVTVIAIAGNLNTTNADRLDAFISRARQHLGDHVVLDLCEVPLLDRSGLRVLLNARALTRQYGGDLHLACLQDSPTRLLDNTGARPVLTVHHSVEQAILAALHACRAAGVHGDGVGETERSPRR